MEVTMIVSKNFTWASAHILPNHDGKCSRLHGHNYKAQVSVEIPDWSIPRLRGPQEGMVLDFGLLTKIVKTDLIDEWDHRFLVAGDEWPWFVGEWEVEDHFAFVGVRTTAENLAAYLADEIFFRLRYLGMTSSLAVQVTLWETETSTADAFMPGCDIWLDAQAELVGQSEERRYRLGRRKQWLASK